MDLSLLNPDLLATMNSITKEQGEVLFMGTLKDKEILPFGIPRLDRLTHGGMRYGVSMEYVGDESSGKSTLVLASIKSFQKREAERLIELQEEAQAVIDKAKTDKQKAKAQSEYDDIRERIAVILDLEYTTTNTWLRKNGVDDSKVIIYQPTPQGVEKPLDDIINMTKSGQVGFVAIDSVGAMISTTEQENDIGKGNYGGISKALTKYYKMMMPYVNKNNMIHIVVNQTREDMAGFGQLVRPGGKMNKFAQSIVLHLSPSGALNEKYAPSEKTGTRFAKQSIVKLPKNKMAGADRPPTMFAIRANYGMDVSFDVVKQAEIDGLLDVAGSWYTIYNPRTGEYVDKVQGISKVVTYMDENPEIRQDFIDIMYQTSIKETLSDDYLHGGEEDESE